VIPVSNIICEYPLPFEKFIDQEQDEDFGGIKWDELAFDTFSFFNDNEFQKSSYLISEDGLFYEHVFNVELCRNENDELFPKEIDAGLTRQEFTGEITFGTEIFGKDYDYEIIFQALFFKGELKELNLDSFEKKDNSKRKEIAKKLHNELRKENKKKRSPFYLFISAAKFTVGCLIEIPKWILYKAFSTIIKLELWAKNK
tara:strand:- start:119 stop:718 length:600 start_codon:yes stop_codon:yes gene_type:complete